VRADRELSKPPARPSPALMAQCWPVKKQEFRAATIAKTARTYTRGGGARRTIGRARTWGLSDGASKNI